MRIEAVQAELRPRSPFEAVDLGLQVLRRFAGPVWLAWATLILPLQVLLLVLSGLTVGLGWGVFLIWWLKPAYDRAVLLVLARGLFGDVPSLPALFGALRLHCRRGLLADLTLRRFTASRSLVLPVSQLEDLAGPAATDRRRTLTHGLSSAAHSALLTSIALESVVWSGLWGGLFLLAPDDIDVDPTALFSSLSAHAAWLAWLAALAYAIALAAIEPLYVAFGFGLYLNRRTELEGWDVELSFRRMARRLGALAVLCGCVALAGSAQAQAADVPDAAQPYDEAPYEQTPYEEGLEPLPAGEPEETELGVLPYLQPHEDTRRAARAAIDAVMARDELFDRETVSYWEADESEPPSLLPLSLVPVLRALAVGLEWLLWASLVAGVLGGVWYSFKRLREHDGEDAEPPMPLLPETYALPAQAARLPLSDVSAAARDHMARGELSQALGALYGGAIRSFVERDGLRLEASATEGDCLYAVQQDGAALAPAQTSLFAQVTQAWARAAYAHESPKVAQVEALCDAYDATFGARR